jgi:hypothetical protein
LQYLLNYFVLEILQYHIILFHLFKIQIFIIIKKSSQLEFLNFQNQSVYFKKIFIFNQSFLRAFLHFSNPNFEFNQDFYVNFEFFNRLFSSSYFSI